MVEPASPSRPPRILIDGRSGSGKTELALALAAAWPAAQILRLDELYPGWDGLAAGSRMLHDDVLAASDPGYTSWDWARALPGRRCALDRTRPLIVEGCGALTASNRALADLGVWIELDASARRLRALARDGDAYAPHWERWARQEDAMIAAEHPQRLAELVLDGADVSLALPALVAGIDAAGLRTS